jgi:hypothetical protein
MDHTTLIRLISGVLAVAVFGLIIWRRGRATE